MALTFDETMRGTLLDADGAPHLLEFTVAVEAHDGGRFLRRGDARLSGVVTVQPWARDRVLEGRFRLTPRGMDYAFDFEGADGAPWSLVGRKDLRWTSPLSTATALATTLSRDGVEVATGIVRFDLNDLPALAASWRPGSSRRTVDLGRRLDGLPNLPPLDAAQQATLRAYAEVVIVPGEHVAPVDDATVEGALAVLQGFPSHVQAGYRLALGALDAAARLRTGRRFADLSPARRQAVFGALDAVGAAGTGLKLLLGMPVKTAAFNRPAYLAAVGAPSYDNPVREPEPRWMENVLTPDDLDPVTELEADVIVIGTGAGGGVMAAELAEQGLGVAVLEAGLFRGRKQFSGSPHERLQRFYTDAGMTFSVGNTVVSIPTGRLVGGSTAINSGSCFRTPEGVFQEWRARGFPAEFDPQGFDPYFRRVEEELGVAPADRAHVGRIADVVAAGADALGAEHHPLPRNAPGCDGQGVCPVGCPTDARRSTNVSYVPRALRAGATLFTGMPVHRLHRRGRRVVAVEARSQTATGEPRRLRIRARAVVVACGTFASPLLLGQNGIRSPQLGRNLSIHPAVGMFARTPQRLDPWDAIPQSYGVTGLVDPRVRFEGFYVPPQLVGGLMPADGAELTRWMDAAAHVGQYGFMVRDPNVGRVVRGPGGAPIVRYSVTPDVVDLVARGSATLCELLLRGGAEEVLTGLGGAPRVRTVAEARALAHRIRKPSQLRLAAFHPLGTCRMGATGDDGVVDFDHRVWGTENLYVVDGSAVPSSLGVNPQITIMAMATRAADRLGEGLR
jgi:choline dehydrogenase-like flavoprotein